MSKVFKTIANVVAAPFGLLGSVLGGGNKGAPDAAPGPKVMPIADDDAITRAKKRSLLASRSGGRAGTMLTTDDKGLSTTLGG